MCIVRLDWYSCGCAMKSGNHSVWLKGVLKKDEFNLKYTIESLSDTKHVVLAYSLLSIPHLV